MTVVRPYMSALPEVFPFVAQVRDDLLPGYLHALNMATNDVPNGSSYAVTSNAPEGYRYLWLSNVSRLTLESLPNWVFPIMATDTE